MNQKKRKLLALLKKWISKWKISIFLSHFIRFVSQRKKCFFKIFLPKGESIFKKIFFFWEDEQNLISVIRLILTFSLVFKQQTEFLLYHDENWIGKRNFIFSLLVLESDKFIIGSNIDEKFAFRFGWLSSWFSFIVYKEISAYIFSQGNHKNRKK